MFLFIFSQTREPVSRTGSRALFAMEPVAWPSPAAWGARDAASTQLASTRLDLKQANKLLRKLAKVKTWSYLAKQEPGASQERLLKAQVERLEQCIHDNTPGEFTFEDRHTLETYYNGWTNRRKKQTWKMNQIIRQVRWSWSYLILSFCALGMSSRKFSWLAFFVLCCLFHCSSIEVGPLLPRPPRLMCT